mgnify:CR=1 FL=1
MNIDELQTSMNALESGICEDDDNKILGECESCGMDTVLVEDIGLCGPCCFGDADTINGNW